MKKRLCLFLVFVICFTAAAVPAFAVEWPPKSYDMPRTVLTPKLVTDSLAGLRSSIKSMGNTGLLILGITLSVSLIFSMFDDFFLGRLRLLEAVKKNEFRRSVRAMDRAKNLDAIVDDRVAEMEINGMARQKYRQLHPEADLEERLYQRQLAYTADLEFRQLHPEVDLERRLYQRQLSHAADQEFWRRNPGLDIEQAVHRKEISHEATEVYRRRHPGEDLEDGVYRYGLNREVKQEYWRRQSQ